jgi:rhamnogalacturonyl hydrolase YesR
MRAFRLARFSAPPFLSACGLFPEVSESASDQLHAIVNDLATRRLNKGRHVRALQQKLRRLAAAPTRRQRPNDLVDQITDDLTAVLDAEATAAYLFGLSVGMTVRALPERLER